MQKVLIIDELEGHKTIECQSIQEVKETLKPYINREDMWFYNSKGE